MREQQKLTQKTLALLTGISERQIIKIELGNLDPRTSTSLKIACALNTTVEALLGTQQSAPDTNQALEI